LKFGMPRPALTGVGRAGPVEIREQARRARLSYVSVAALLRATPAASYESLHSSIRTWYRVMLGRRSLRHA
jgi:hypothetical protein